MKLSKLMIFSAAMLYSATLMAQIEKPVKWSYLVTKVDKDHAFVTFRALIENGWHIYSQNTKDGGPVKTSFTFVPSKDFSLVGKTTEPKSVAHYEPTFKMNVSYFEGKVLFKQNLKVNKQPTVVKAKVEYMVCNDKQCLPPDEVEFSIPVK